MIKLAMRLFLLFSLLSIVVPQKAIMDYSDYGWAVFLNRIGENKTAKETLLKHKDKDLFYYNKLGEFEGINYKKALFYFKKGEKFDSAEPIILKNIGKTYFFLFFKSKKNSDINNAKRYFKRYLKIDKTDFFVNYLYGESLKYSGEITKGVEYLINAYQINPSATRILKDIIRIKLSLKDYFWVILKYKQFKLLNYLSAEELDNVLEFIEQLKIKSTDKNYNNIRQFLNAIKPEGNLNILKRLIIINFKNKNYSKVVNLYVKNKKLFEEIKPPVIERFYLFSLYYSENYYEFSKEVNRRIKENPDSEFLRYLLSRYYYRFGYKKLPFIYIRNIDKPSFISDDFYNDYKTLVETNYWLFKKDSGKIEKILSRFSSNNIKKSSLLLKINLLKAALFVNEEQIIKSLLKENNRYLHLIYLCKKRKPEDILKQINLNKKEAITILNELVNNGRIKVLYDILNKIDKQTIKPEQFNFYLGRYYERSGKYKKAYKYYKKTIEKNNSISYLNYYVYFSLMHDYKIKNREKIIERFIKEGKSAAVYDTLGLLLIKSNKKRKGEKYLLKAYIFTPEDKLIKMHLADYYYSIENYKKALYFYEKSEEGESFTDEYIQNIKRIKSRLKELKKIDFNIENYFGLYSVKIYLRGKVTPLRLKLKYDNNHLLLSFYHFPMTKMADIYTNGSTYFINYKDKRFYEGQFGNIIENIIGININKEDILNLFGIKEGINFIPYKDIEISSYKEGFPERIEIKGGNIRIRIKLLKFNTKKKIIIKQPDTDKFNEVFDIREVLGE
jgi:tetratricopeptide (TPR) repeat protein